MLALFYIFVTPAGQKQKLSVQFDKRRTVQAPAAETMCETLQLMVEVSAINQLTTLPCLERFVNSLSDTAVCTRCLEHSNMLASHKWSCSLVLFRLCLSRADRVLERYTIHLNSLADNMPAI